MRDQDLVNALREHAEWAEGNQWETPITLGDDLTEAADQLENQNAHIAALQQEIEKLREQLRHLCRNYDLARLEELAEADKDGRVVVLPCEVGTATYYIHYPIAVYPDKSEPEIKRGIFTLCDLDRVGHSVFLTREEAEKALEAMKNGN